MSTNTATPFPALAAAITADLLTLHEEEQEQYRFMGLDHAFRTLAVYARHWKALFQDTIDHSENYTEAQRNLAHINATDYELQAVQAHKAALAILTARKGRIAQAKHPVWLQFLEAANTDGFDKERLIALYHAHSELDKEWWQAQNAETAYYNLRLL